MKCCAWLINARFALKAFVSMPFPPPGRSSLALGTSFQNTNAVNRFPDVSKAVETLPRGTVVDGEVVALDDAGGGYMTGSHGVDSIIVGYRKGQELAYVGRVRAGFVTQHEAKYFESCARSQLKRAHT
jgi:ATP-dependent DNA ligase